MAWSNSKIFSAYITDIVNNTTSIDGNSDSFKAALFDNSLTPSQTVASASSAFNTGVWTGAGAPEVFQAVQWPTGGVALASITSTFASNVYTFDAADTASGSAATLAAVFGCLVYVTTAATVTNQGLCFNYFGGTNSVTSGTFTIVWNALGIWYLTL